MGLTNSCLSAHPGKNISGCVGVREPNQLQEATIKKLHRDGEDCRNGISMCNTFHMIFILMSFKYEYGLQCATVRDISRSLS